VAHENKMRTFGPGVSRGVGKILGCIEDGTFGTGRSFATRQWRKTMAEENRTPNKKIGEIQHAEEQTKRTTGHLPPHGPGTDPKEDVRANSDRDPSKKKTGEF
jgi:hypothetical protein